MINKKLLITSVVVVTVSMGTVFAQSDAGQTLQRWYDSQFQQSINNINEDTVKPLSEDMKKQIEAFGISLIDGAKQRIENSAQDSIWYSIGSIFIHDGKYIDEIRTKKEELVPKVSTDFDNLVNEKNQETNSVIDNETKKFLNDLNDELDGRVSDTSKDIQNTSSKAQENLKSSISTAKSQINEQITLNQERSEKELNTSVDTTISKGKETIENFAKTYSNEKVQAIEKKTKDFDSEAQQSLSTIILNINN